MPKGCAVVGCHNHSWMKKELSFLLFPNEKKGPERRRQWVKAMNRILADGSPWVPSKHSPICSDHFVTGRQHPNRHHVDYLPSLFFIPPDGLPRVKGAERRFEPAKTKKQRDASKNLWLQEMRAYYLSLDSLFINKPAETQANSKPNTTSTEASENAETRNSPEDNISGEPGTSTQECTKSASSASTEGSTSNVTSITNEGNTSATPRSKGINNEGITNSEFSITSAEGRSCVESITSTDITSSTEPPAKRMRKEADCSSTVASIDSRPRSKPFKHSTAFLRIQNERLRVANCRLKQENIKHRQDFDNCKKLIAKFIIIKKEMHKLGIKIPEAPSPSATDKTDQQQDEEKATSSQNTTDTNKETERPPLVFNVDPDEELILTLPPRAQEDWCPKITSVYSQVEETSEPPSCPQ